MVEDHPTSQADQHAAPEWRQFDWSRRVLAVERKVLAPDQRFDKPASRWDSIRFHCVDWSAAKVYGSQRILDM
jgi:hypothetical protein